MIFCCIWTNKYSIYLSLLNLFLLVAATTLHKKNKSNTQQIENLTVHNGAFNPKDLQFKRIAHDLRSSYFGVITMCGQISAQVQAGENVSLANLKHLIKACEYHKKLMTELLDVSKFAAASSEGPVYSQVNVVSEIENIILAHAAIGESEKAKTMLQVQLGFPPSIVTDKMKLSRIFSNLYTNALKFTRPGTSVHISLSSDASSWNMTVKDNGPGISPEQLSQFSRIENMQNDPGERMGINIIYYLTNLLHGRIRASSNSDGLSFEIHFPLRVKNKA